MVELYKASFQAPPLRRTDITNFHVDHGIEKGAQREYACDDTVYEFVEAELGSNMENEHRKGVQ